MLPQQPNNFYPSSGLIPANSLGQRLCAIFSHPWHFIFKDVADSSWQTETTYPLDPRNLWHRWQDATELIGVRFGKKTRYALLDIDFGSPYHPATDPDALRSLIHCLESIGVYRTLLLRSSDSNGLHLYIPFSESLPSYGIALALKHCLMDAGFSLAPGALESFPNCKAYLKGSYTNYHAHRLPLQSGSYLLDSDGQIISDDLNHFLASWEAAAAGNDIDELTEAIAAATLANKKTCRPSLGRSVLKWREDSERTIEEGWTARGQTNELLKIIARYGIVFNSLAGEELVKYVIATATSAPGYAEFCNHQQEIERRATAWARECEKYYRPHPSHPGFGNPWTGEREKADRRRARNETASSNAIDRIKQAVTAVGKTAITSIRELASSIATAAKTSLTTLYKHLDLWHPEHTGCNSQEQPIECDTALNPPQSESPPESLKPLQDGLLHPLRHKKVLIGVTAEISFTDLQKVGLPVPNTVRRPSKPIQNPQKPESAQASPPSQQGSCEDSC